jgi:Domain of unknown function (DUF4126)
MATLLSACLGIGLAAACGFRVFVPLLAINLAARAGLLGLTPGFDWLASTPALIAFAVATALEVAAYYVPWVDNALDAVATPLAVVAGVMVTASVVGDMSPLLRWSLALIAGGGTAGAVQALTGLVRGASTLTTGGLGNFVVATVELVGAAVLSLLALLLPVAAAVLVVIVLVLAFRRLATRGSRRTPAAARSG